MSTMDEVTPADVDRGHLLPQGYDDNTLATFVMVDAECSVLAEGVKFSDGRVVVCLPGGRILNRYANVPCMVEDWMCRGFLLWSWADRPGRHRMRRFILQRNVDVTGFSGPGVAVEGVQFTHGGVSLMWLGEVNSLVEWPSIELALATHGHDGATALRWLDEPA